MFNAAQVLPASPGEAEADVFPLRERLRFRDSFGLALLDVRARSVPFQSLTKGPWALFIAIAVHWQSNAEAWPSQETLARFSGWSTRAVRDQANVLERDGFIRIRRERRVDGSERIFYAPGLVTLSALAEFVERFPRERAKVLAPVASAPAPIAETTSTHPPEMAAGAPPEGASMEHRDQDQMELSYCESEAVIAPPPAEEQQQVEFAEDDKETARVALGERMARKYPTRRAPRWFDAGDVAMVAACSSALEGDREAKLQAHHEAIVGAFCASRNGAPTVRFVWGKLDHFFDHLERGRRKLRAEREAQLRAEREVEPTQRVTRVAAPWIPPAQVQADLERVFGPGWRTHVPR
jgi:hypothetical protein